jgi:hypothetical protein
MFRRVRTLGHGVGAAGAGGGNAAGQGGAGSQPRSPLAPRRSGGGRRRQLSADLELGAVDAVAVRMQSKISATQQIPSPYRRGPLSIPDFAELAALQCIYLCR